MSFDGTAIRVHQTLHGYEDGHRLIAGSTQFKGRDEKTLLVLSDVSGPNAIIPKSGYLTGYPLQESGFYALARTWAAQEMPRPGCVWTHTLLIDFTDLSSLECINPIIQAFHRPLVPISKSTYEKILDINSDELLNNASNSPTNFMRSALSTVLSALYNKADDKVVVLASEEWNREYWVLKLWQQQWPRLRRNFRFCTLSYADRSTKDVKFDLQVLPEARSDQKARVKITGTMVDLLFPADELEDSLWLNTAVDDLLLGQQGELKIFLRRVGSDIEKGRRAFAPLCELYSVLSDSSINAPLFNRAVGILTQFGAKEAKVAKKMVVERIVEHITEIDDPPFPFILSNLNLLEQVQLEHEAAALGKAIWVHDKQLFWPLLAEEGSTSKIASQAIEMLTLDELISGIEEVGASLQRLLQIRPTIPSAASFWKISEKIIKDTFEIISSNPLIAEISLAAMIKSGVRGLASRVDKLLDRKIILSAVTNYLDHAEMESLSEMEDEWVIVSSIDLDSLASHLATGRVLTKRTLFAFSRNTRPDSIPNASGDDPWLIAMRESKGTLSEIGRIYLASYLLARALGNCSRSAGELFAFVFDDVYKAAADSRLPKDAWQLLEPRLPWVSFWYDWDKCWRLRSAIADVFVNNKLSYETYVNFTSDEEIFLEVTTVMSKTRRGRIYLKAVRKRLGHKDDYLTSVRMQIIKKIID